jgi:hypothetical protein
MGLLEFFFGGSNELWFTALGAKGTGKTSLLACMQKSFDNEVIAGCLNPDRETFSELNIAYKQLQKMGEGDGTDSDRVTDFVAITEYQRKYRFTLKGAKESVQVHFFDFPGYWMNPHAPDENAIRDYNNIIKIVQNSMVVIVAIDTPYLMEADGRYANFAMVDEVEQVLIESLDKDNEPKLILLVPIKCERYTHHRKEVDRLLNTIEQYFLKTYSLKKNPYYAERLALAIVPIHTIGNVEFSRFDIEQGKPSPKFLRNGANAGFKPRDADQPFRYAISFLMNQYDRKRSGFWRKKLNSWFGKDNLKQVADIIRTDMREDEERGIKIIYGHDLIGL